MLLQYQREKSDRNWQRGDGVQPEVTSLTQTFLCAHFFCKLLLFLCIQKQPPELFYKKGVLKNFAKFTGKDLCQILFSKKKKLWHRCFPVNFAKFLRILFLQSTSWKLLLYISWSLIIWQWAAIKTHPRDYLSVWHSYITISTEL